MVAAAKTFDPQRALALAAETFEIEARALLGLKARQGDGFARAVDAMLRCQGRVVVMGMGKSGHVGRKIAATLASTGTPAFFVHPAEASHGDLGMVQPGDVLLAISNSGESEELAAILPAIRRIGVTLVAMTGQAQSTLAGHADIVLSSAAQYQTHIPRQFLPTISLQLDFMNGAPLGQWVQGEATILQVTKNLVFSQGLITCNDKPVARASGVFRRGPLLPDSESDHQLDLPGMPARR